MPLGSGARATISKPGAARFNFERIGSSFRRRGHRAGKGIGLGFSAELRGDGGLVLILDHARAAQPFGGVRTSEAVIFFGRIFQAKYGRASQRARAISAW